MQLIIAIIEMLSLIGIIITGCMAYKGLIDVCIVILLAALFFVMIAIDVSLY